MEQLIQFKDVVFHYPQDRKSIFENLTLQIPKGKKCVMIGPNGCGKSTLFLLITGFLQPATGQLFYKEKAYSYKRKELKELRKQIGIVMQNSEHQMIAPLVFDDIAFGLRNLGMPEEEVQRRVLEIANKMNVSELLDRPIHYLSGGQKKRVALAGILIINPELVLLDEPTTFLDAVQVKALKKTLEEMHQNGVTTLIATHDLDFAYEWADWMILMNEGKIVAQGTPDECLTNYFHLLPKEYERPLVFELKRLVNTKLEEELLEAVKRFLNKTVSKDNVD